MLKTSKYDFSLPPSRTPSSTRSSTGKDCYYYYVYRKKIDPTEIKRPEDLPLPSLFRRNNLQTQSITGSLPGLNEINETKNQKENFNNFGDFAVESRKQSSSLPELKKLGQSLSKNGSRPKRKKKDKVQLKKPVLKKNGKEHGIIRNEKSPPLPGIKGEKRISSSLSSFTDFSDDGYILAKYPMAMSLLKLTPEDGLQWARHTTISKGPNG